MARLGRKELFYDYFEIIIYNHLLPTVSFRLKNSLNK